MRIRTLLVAVGLWAVAIGTAAQPVHELVQSDPSCTVVRSFESLSARDTAEPSVALLQDAASLGSAPAGFGPLPSFSVQGGLATVTVAVDPGTNLYATGSQAGPLERNGRRVEFYNLDNFGWGDGSNRNYQTHPWVLAVRADGSAFGVLFDTTWPSALDTELPFAEGIVFQCEGPSPRVVTIDGDSPQDVVKKLAELTGYPFMPPMWSVGYHQSKYSYTPQSTALAVAQEFRTRSIPAEVIWMDIDYMDGFRNFTFNPFDFPDPAQLNTDLDGIDFQAVWMANCGVKAEGGYFAFDEMQAQGLAVQRSNGSTFFGDVWPGNSVWPDFTMQATRDWWAGRIASFASIGVDGIWNDMNEPAVFNVGSKTMPDDNRHRADADLGGTGPHRKYHNIYGMQMSRATRDGMLQAFPDKRPFVLTRAGYMGGQRYAAMWTGDNNANWYHVDVSIQNILNIGLSGQPNCGPDIGGFNGDSGGPMYARWMGSGAMMPFARGHYGFSAISREPWSYGSDTEDTSRLALNRRYRLLNHFYTAFYEAHTTGLPVCRPLFFAEPHNPDLRFWDNGFLVGEGLLVVAATTFAGEPQVPPTETELYRVAFPDSSAAMAPLDTYDPDLPDLYVLAGHVVPANAVVQHSRDLSSTRSEPIELLVALDENGAARGEMYEDDGDNFGYLSGEFVRYEFEATTAGGQTTIEVRQIGGTDAPQPRTWTVRLLTGNAQSVDASATGATPTLVLATPPLTPDAQPDPALNDGLRIGDRFGPANLRATNPDSRYAEISQLRALYARPGPGGLEIGIEGELAIDGTAIALFIDAQPGGQNTINTSSLNPPPGGLQDLTGTRMDEGFEPDRMLFANAFDGNVFCDWVTLAGGGSKTYLGRQFVGSGDATLVEGNSLGIQIALGTTTHAAGGGFEIVIPYSLIGTGTGLLNEVKVFAAVVKPWGQVTNQTLPAVGPDWPSFSPDFRTIAGEQFARVFVDPDLTGDGEWDFFDTLEYLRRHDAGDLATDLASPFGVLDDADVRAFLQGAMFE